MIEIAQVKALILKNFYEDTKTKRTHISDTHEGQTLRTHNSKHAK